MSKPEQLRRVHRRLAADAGDLIAALDALYPARPPRLTDSDRQVWYDAGARSVVEFLKTLQEEATRSGNVLET